MIDDDPFACLDQVMEYCPMVHNNPQLVQELASIHCCDMTLVWWWWGLFTIVTSV
jgi:hypothetical protein